MQTQNVNRKRENFQNHFHVLSLFPSPFSPRLSLFPFTQNEIIPISSKTQQRPKKEKKIMKFFKWTKQKKTVTNQPHCVFVRNAQPMSMIFSFKQFLFFAALLLLAVVFIVLFRIVDVINGWLHFGRKHSPARNRIGVSMTGLCGPPFARLIILMVGWFRLKISCRKWNRCESTKIHLKIVCFEIRIERRFV